LKGSRRKMRKRNQMISLHEGIPSTFDWKTLISSNPHWLVEKVSGFPGIFIKLQRMIAN